MHDFQCVGGFGAIPGDGAALAGAHFNSEGENRAGRQRGKANSSAFGHPLDCLDPVSHCNLAPDGPERGLPYRQDICKSHLFVYKHAKGHVSTMLASNMLGKRRAVIPVICMSPELLHTQRNQRLAPACFDLVTDRCRDRYCLAGVRSRRHNRVDLH